MRFVFDESQLKKINRLLFIIGFLKIRMIGYVRPKAVKFTSDIFVLKLRLNRRTKNHFNTMYLGALSVGADLAVGLPAFHIARERNLNLSLAFKNMSSDYISRPDSDVYFVLENPSQLIDFIDEINECGQRVTKNIPTNAYIHYGTVQQKLVASFVMGLSLKIKK